MKKTQQLLPTCVDAAKKSYIYLFVICYVDSSCFILEYLAGHKDLKTIFKIVVVKLFLVFTYKFPQFLFLLPKTHLNKVYEIIGSNGFGD
jgi:hypothetical protein